MCRLAPPSWLRTLLVLVVCIAYVFQWGYDGKQPSIVSLGTTFRVQFVFYILPVLGPVSLLEVDVGSVPVGYEVAIVCNPIRMGRWSELMVVCVCHSNEVMREADTNDT